MQLPVFPSANPLVVQHNAMVNAGFALSALEMRCFVALLSRIRREDTYLPLCRIPVQELCPDSTSKNVYREVREMMESLAKRALRVEVLGPSGERLSEPDIKNRPLMGAIDYLRGEGVVEAVFNEHLKPYLVELKNNFTKAQLSQLLKIKRPASHRIYWLLREYAAFGKRRVSVPELRHVLGLQEEYADRFDHFRTRVLDPAQQELTQTDLPFTYELIKQGRTITEIQFLFAPTTAGGESDPHLELEPPLEEWARNLLALGVAVRSLDVVRTKLAAGDYDEGYVNFALAHVREGVRKGRIKKEAGAVFKALSDGYLLPTYRKSQLPPPKANKPAKTRQLPLPQQKSRLREEIATLWNTYHTIPELPVYAGEEAKAEARERCHQRIQVLEQQLAGLR